MCFPVELKWMVLCQVIEFFQIVCSIMEPFTHFSQHMLDSETSPVDGKFTCHSNGHGFNRGTLHTFHIPFPSDTHTH